MAKTKASEAAAAMARARTNYIGVYSGLHQWVLLDLANLKDKQTSEVFQLGTYFWRLLCYPKQDITPGTHMSLYLEYPFADSTPAHLCPKVSYKFSVHNHQEPKNSVSYGPYERAFGKGSSTWGIRSMPTSDITTSSGFLRADGALVIRVELTVLSPRKRPRDLGSDFLSLLEEPGSTSDLTLRVKKRTFPVHRTILAARCPFFRTLFAGEFADSGAKELPLPDTNPDALALLLRYIYGDTLAFPPELLKPAAELADRWQLTEAQDELLQQIGESTTVRTVVQDLLWAESRGAEGLVGKLEGVYVMNAAAVPEADVMTLAERNPQLLGRLHIAVAKAGAKAK